MFRLLAAILHLGNIKIVAGRQDANIDDTDPALQLATRFLGVNLAEFKKWTVKKQIVTRNEKIIASLNATQATVVRDSVAKFVYACMFEWLVAIVNESLAGENGDAAERAEMFIGVLDIYGFEHFQKVCQRLISSFFRHSRTHLELFRTIQHQLCQREASARGMSDPTRQLTLSYSHRPKVQLARIQIGARGICQGKDQLDLHRFL